MDRLSTGPGHVRARRRALTLIELLVVVAVIGLMAALVLPAVQSAREASRRAQCANNLKQLGIALHLYEAAAGMVPSGGRFSPHAHLLPYLDGVPLYNAVNFAQGSEYGGTVWGNRTAFEAQLASFLCPSDQVDPLRVSGTSYAANWGVGFGRDEHAHNGLFASPAGGSITFASVTDGTSNTAAFAEWCLGHFHSGRDPLRTIFQTRLGASAATLEVVSQFCLNLDRSTNLIYQSSKGDNWLKSGLKYTAYNHTLAVNQNTCRDGSSLSRAAWTSGSQHPGGAHTLFADGSVRFVREGIDLQTWRALGTRNGGEVVSLAE